MYKDEPTPTKKDSMIPVEISIRSMFAKLNDLSTVLEELETKMQTSLGNSDRCASDLSSKASEEEEKDCCYLVTQHENISRMIDLLTERVFILKSTCEL